MEAMGGSLGLEEDLTPVAAAAADPNPGAVFWLELPMAPRPSGAVTVAEVDLPLWPSTRVEELPPDARTVLLIEDNLSNVRLIERLMEAHPTVRLLCAMQGGLGLDLARQHRPDLILLDLQLPDLSGEEVLARLHAEAVTRDTPVVVISADAIGSQVERLMQAGAYAYLTKPLDVREFLKVVREALLVGALTSSPHASPPR